jgi:predicted DsbA family dithiol-disulfide isomerase
MSEQDAALHIDIYSDVICPWCYVGKRRLEQALAQVKDRLNLRITWRPFQLNPTMPVGGMERTVYLKAKFGSLGIFKDMEQRLLEAGASEHIPFAFEKIARTPNTFGAHRLIWYAAQQGCQNEMVDQLFKGYFEEGADIGSIPTLVRLAAQVGLTAEPFLCSDEGIAEVKADEAAGHRLGIRGVPYFVLNQAQGISGAQPAEVLAAAMEQAGAQQGTGSAGKR